MRRTLTATAAVTLSATGCTTTGPGGVLIVSNGTNTLAVTASTHSAMTLPTHAAAYVLGTLVAAALVAALIWLVHNRGKLAALAASAATKV